MGVVNSVARALAIVEELDRADDRGVPLGEVARACRLKGPTAHSLLATLCELGYAIHDPATRLYSLGMRAAALGRQRYLAGTLAAAARPVLEELGRRLGETVLLAMYRSGRRHTVLTVESDQQLRVAASPAVDDQFYTTATGRVLLSQLPEAELDAVTDRLGPPGSAWPEAADAAALRAALEQLRGMPGIVLRRGGVHIHALAVPVAPATQGACAALGVYYPDVRGTRAREREFMPALCDAAAQVRLRFENQ